MSELVFRGADQVAAFVENGMASYGVHALSHFLKGDGLVEQPHPERVRLKVGGVAKRLNGKPGIR